jgi:single-strand DNA-binding protein
MKSVNKVILIGNLVRDPETTQINANTDVSKFTLAVNESYKKPTGETVENTTYIDCEAWGGLSKVASQYLKKGSKVYVEGNLRADTWQDADSGKTRTKHKVRILDLVMLDTRRNEGGSYSGNNTSDTDGATVQPVDDDELPF